jgi:ribose transport system permease protein
MTVVTDTRVRLTKRDLGAIAQSRYATLAYPFLTIVALLTYFAIRNGNFLTVDNFLNIGRQASVLLLMALAGTVVILIGSIDLSVAANTTLAGIITAEYLDSAGYGGALTIAIAVAAAVGCANGVIYTVLRIPSFLVTLGMLSVLTGISNKISGGEPVIFVSRDLPQIVNDTLVWRLPNVVLIALGAALVLTIVGFRTKFGRYLYAIGGGEPVARLSGVPLKQYKIAAFTVAGALCGVAGAILTAQIQAGTPLAADPLLLDSVAAVVIGGTALSGGVGGFHRTVLGVLVIAILSNGMDVTNVHPYTQSIVKGLVVIGAVALTIDRKKYPFMK